MNTKLVKTIREAIALAGLKDGMTISFHHHLRNGDYVLNLVMDEIAAMGIRDLTVNASALFDTHAPLLDHIKNHVVRKVQTNYISAGIGRQISAGLMDEPVEFRTHGGRPRDIALGITPIDVAFIAAPCSDHMGNCTGKYGRSACGSLGYAFSDAMYAKKVVVITDELAEYPLTGWSIPEIYVDYVVQIDAIGDPAGIAVNPRREELRERLTQAGMQVLEITQLRALAEQITGTPAPLPPAGRVIAKVIGRDGTLLDTIGERKGEE